LFLEVIATMKGDPVTLTLRQARITELPAIYRGEQDYIRRWEPEHEDAWHHQMERHLTRWVSNFERITVACLDDQLVGYSLWMPEDGKAELCTLNVSSEHRRKGVGRALLQTFALNAAHQGFSVLALSVRADNPARLMYEQAGFMEAGIASNGYLKYERRQG
jgi:ribosomal protein S18 acetylase RimI-like enzyme